MRSRHAQALSAAALLASSTACQSFFDVDVEYEPCVQPQIPYEEEFRDGRQGLSDRCWEFDNESANEVFVDDGDLVIRLKDSGMWTPTEQAPMAYRRLEGNFIVAARVEALGKTNADHCLPESNLAGIVVRRAEPTLEWASLMLGPDLEEMGVQCEDESDNPPRARVRVHSPTWGPAMPDFPDPDFTQTGIGDDGEADIAVCRLDNELLYFYRDINETDPLRAWKSVDGPAEHDVGDGPLDVGLTAAVLDDPAQATFDVEGHFNWIVLDDDLGADGCGGVLDTLKLPKGD